MAEAFPRQQASISPLERCLQELHAQSDSIRDVMDQINECRDENKDLRAMLKNVSDGFITPLQEEVKKTEQRLDTQLNKIVEQGKKLEVQKTMEIQLAQINENLANTIEDLELEKNMISDDLKEKVKHYEATLSSAVLDTIISLGEKESICGNTLIIKDSDIKILQDRKTKIQQDHNSDMLSEQKCHREEMNKLIQQNELEVQLKNVVFNNTDKIQLLQSETEKLTETLRSKDLEIEALVSLTQIPEKEKEIEMLKDQNKKLKCNSEKMKADLFLKKHWIFLLEVDHERQLRSINQQHEYIQKVITKKSFEEICILESNLKKKEENLTEIQDKHKGKLEDATTYLKHLIKELSLKRKIVFVKPQVKVDNILPTLQCVLEKLTSQ